jgi:hypothetical protein
MTDDQQRALALQVMQHDIHMLPNIKTVKEADTVRDALLAYQATLPDELSRGTAAQWHPGETALVQGHAGPDHRRADGLIDDTNVCCATRPGRNGTWIFGPK